MGLFDRIVSNVASQAIGKVVSNAIDDAFEKNRQNNQPQNTQAQTQAQGLPAPKPSVMRTFNSCHSRPDGTDFWLESSFMLSQDFVETNSGALEIEQAFIYCPDHKDGAPDEPAGDHHYIMVASGLDEVYRSVKEYLKSGTVKKAISCEPANKGQMLFKAKLDYHDEYMILYGFTRQISGEPCGLCLTYKKRYDKTPIVSKMLAELDEAAQSYSEHQTEDPIKRT